MNYIWAFMILVGIVYAGFHGTLPDVANGALNSAKEAVTLCLTMAGVMSFWTGLMQIAEKSGMIAGLSAKLKPFLRFMFPNLPKEHPANTYIATNMIANVFGLGWAATPAGLKAMEELSKLEEERGALAYAPLRKDVSVGRKKSQAGKAKNENTLPPAAGVTAGRAASNEMCTFLIINISSLQLIPVNVIAYRSQYGSVNPSGIVGPAIAATAVSTLVAIIFCKIMNRKVM